MRYYFIKESKYMTPLKKYIWLVDTLMRGGSRGLTLEQICRRYYYDDVDGGNAYNKRSFHRHRNEVRDVFGIEIECYVGDSGNHLYRIADSGSNDYFRRWLMDSIAINRVLEASRETAQYIGVEPTHTESLSPLLQALKDNNMISFDYAPYWSDHATHYFNFQPHALKMFERRWYLIGRYGDNGQHRIYALDRISNVEAQEETYQRDEDFDLEQMFDGAYGVIIDDSKVESVWIKVDAYQANYLRSLPLHSSQYELRHEKDYSIFSFRLRPTFDLRQRLLSFGSSLEVMKPETLRVEMREEAVKMVQKYQEED